MKIGLYGGSFNPVHIGHEDIVKRVLEKRLVDQVWVIPCRDHAFNKELVPVKDRLNMLKYALKDIDMTGRNVRIDDIEAVSKEKSRTSRTLAQLREKYSSRGYDFSLIIGVDALNDIDKWYDAKYIKDTTGFIVVRREGYALKKNLGVTIEAMVESVMTLSSTDVRERIACGESITGLVNPYVERYIFKNKLYVDNMKFINPAATADLIVPIDGGLLFVKRKHAPFKGYWAFPGGFLNCGKENLEEAAVRELEEETSLKAKTKDLELLGVYSEPNRDSRGHVIAHAYIVKKYTGILKANDDAAEVKVFKTKPAKLAFDHSRAYDDYIRRIKK